MMNEGVSALFSGLQFTQPAWLWLIPGYLILDLGLRRFGDYDQHTGLSGASPYANLLFPHPLLKLLPQAFHKRGESHARRLLHALVFLCLIAAMAQPVRIGAKLPDPPRERDIVFMVDTSVSMLLRDYLLDGQRVDRMNMLKSLLGRFVRQLHGERLSIIVFGDHAHTLVPLTRDQNLLQAQLARIEIGMAGRTSAIGEAIALAVKQAREKSTRRRVLVLLSDADQATGAIPAVAAARHAAEQELPVYTIAIGAADYAAEEQRVGGLIYHPVNLGLLRELAEASGAKAYQAGDSQTLTRAIDDISRRETNPGKAEARHYRQPLYIWPLLLALSLLSVYQLSRLAARKVAKA